MINAKRHWDTVTDKGKWRARGGSLVAKTKATKAIWFPPEPAKTGKKAASSAKRTTRKTTKKTASTAKKAT